jgi:cob(I)alamin adenosyltransferase
MPVRITRVYTRTGDKGDTALVGGRRVPKDSPRIEAYGTIDELSACIGIARTALVAPDAPAGADALAAVLTRIQNELFNLGSDLATLPADRHPKQPVIEARHVTALEREIDGWNETLPELRSFVLPGGGIVAAYLHLARTVCRRAERSVVALGHAEPVGERARQYLNRLSDLLFVLARAANPPGEEPLWKPGASRGEP